MMDCEVNSISFQEHFENYIKENKKQKRVWKRKTIPMTLNVMSAKEYLGKKCKMIKKGEYAINKISVKTYDNDNSSTSRTLTSMLLLKDTVEGNNLREAEIINKTNNPMTNNGTFHDTEINPSTTEAEASSDLKTAGNDTENENMTEVN